MAVQREDRPPGNSQGADGGERSVKDAEAAWRQDVARRHGHNHQVGKAVGDTGAGKQEAMNDQDVEQDGQGNVALADLKAGHQDQCKESVQGQVGNDTGLIVILPAEPGVKRARVDKEQAGQHQADNQPVVIVDSEQLGLLQQRGGRKCAGVDWIVDCHVCLSSLVDQRKSPCPVVIIAFSWQ